MNRIYFKIGLVIIVFFSSLSIIYSVPKVGDEVKVVDSGDFDIEYLNDNFLIYSQKTMNNSNERVIYYEYDFKVEQRRSFGRYLKDSEIYSFDEDSVFIIEVTEKNERNNSLYDYTISIYKKNLEDKERQLYTVFNLINLTTYYYQVEYGVQNKILFRHLIDDFNEFNNETERYESDGEAFDYYLFNEDDFLKVDKVKYASYKEFGNKFENSKFKLLNNVLENKKTSEKFNVDTNLNEICGISSNFIYYLENFYYEGIERPLKTLVKYDYRNDIKQSIIIKDDCITGDLSFYANPYIVDLNTDNYNYLLTDNDKIEILNTKILFLDEEINYINLDLGENIESLNFEDLGDLDLDNLSSLNSNVDLDEPEKKIESDEKATNLNNKNSNREVDDTIKDSFFSNTNNIFYIIIFVEFIFALIVIIVIIQEFFTPKNISTKKKISKKQESKQVKKEKNKFRFKLNLNFKFFKKKRKLTKVNKISLDEIREYKKKKISKRLF